MRLEWKNFIEPVITPKSLIIDTTGITERILGKSTAIFLKSFQWFILQCFMLLILKMDLVFHRHDRL